MCGRGWGGLGGTVCPSVVLFIRHLCVRIITGCVYLVCEGTVDWSTHSCHIPRYKAKQNGDGTGLVLTRLGTGGGQGRAQAEQLTHIIVLITAGMCAPHTAQSA